MAGTPPRLAPTLALAVAWLAIYILWLAIKPADTAVKATSKPGTVVTTTTVKLLVPPIRRPLRGGPSPNGQTSKAR